MPLSVINIFPVEAHTLIWYVLPLTYQPLIVKLPKQYKNKEGVEISTIVFTQTIVLVSELTP